MYSIVATLVWTVLSSLSLCLRSFIHNLYGQYYDRTWRRWPLRYGLCNGSSAVQVVSPPHTLTLTYSTSRHIPGGVATWPADEPLHNPYRSSHRRQVRSISKKRIQKLHRSCHKWSESVLPISIPTLLNFLVANPLSSSSRPDTKFQVEPTQTSAALYGFSMKF